MKFKSCNYKLAESFDKNTLFLCCCELQLEQIRFLLWLTECCRRVRVDQVLHDCGKFVCFDKPQLNKFPVQLGNILTRWSCLRARDESPVMLK